MIKRGFIRVLWGDYSSQHDEGWITPSGRRRSDLCDNE